jgi:hypothetical protein
MTQNALYLLLFSVERREECHSTHTTTCSALLALKLTRR